MTASSTGTTSTTPSHKVTIARIVWAAIVLLAFGMCIMLTVQAVQHEDEARATRQWADPWHTAFAFPPTLVVWRETAPGNRLFLVVANLVAVVSSIPAGLDE